MDYFISYLMLLLCWFYCNKERLLRKEYQDAYHKLHTEYVNDMKELRNLKNYCPNCDGKENKYCPTCGKNRTIFDFCNTWFCVRCKKPFQAK